MLDLCEAPASNRAHDALPTILVNRRSEYRLTKRRTHRGSDTLSTGDLDEHQSLNYAVIQATLVSSSDHIG